MCTFFCIRWCEKLSRNITFHQCAHIHESAWECDDDDDDHHDDDDNDGEDDDDGDDDDDDATDLEAGGLKNFVAICFSSCFLGSHAFIISSNILHMGQDNFPMKR